MYITRNQRETVLGTLVTYEGHNARLSIQSMADGGDPIYKLEHSDAINAPNAMLYLSGGEIVLLLDFHGLCVPEEDWPKVKVAADEMLALWNEYKDSESSTCL